MSLFASNFKDGQNGHNLRLPTSSGSSSPPEPTSSTSPTSPVISFPRNNEELEDDQTSNSSSAGSPPPPHSSPQNKSTPLMSPSTSISFQTPVLPRHFTPSISTTMAAGLPGSPFLPFFPPISSSGSAHPTTGLPPLDLAMVSRLGQLNHSGDVSHLERMFLRPPFAYPFFCLPPYAKVSHPFTQHFKFQNYN